MARGRPKKIQPAIVADEVVVPLSAELPEEDLLGPVGETTPPPVEEPKGKKLVGYHPITGKEVWI